MVWYNYNYSSNVLLLLTVILYRAKKSAAMEATVLYIEIFVTCDAA